MREHKAFVVVVLGMALGLAVGGSAGASSAPHSQPPKVRKLVHAVERTVHPLTEHLRPKEEGPVEFVMIYDRESQDHFVGVIVTPPGGRDPICLCASGHQPPGGHSITWDVIINPTLERTCGALEKVGLCDLRGG